MKESSDALKRSTYYESVFMFKGAPLSYNAFPFWRDIIDSPRFSDDVDQAYRKEVWQCSRQVAKSTNIGILATGLSLQYNNFITIVAQPTDTQISRFSVDVLKKLHNESIVTNILYYNSKTTEQQVKNKSFTNGSRIILGNIHTSVMSMRGIPGSAALFDEYQDIPPGHASVVENALNRSPYRFKLYSGTPLTEENDLNVKFEESTGHEWGVKCTACGHWNIDLGLSNIGSGRTPNGRLIEEVICERCYHTLDVRRGIWIPARWDNGGVPMEYDGFHINELMVPPDTGMRTSILELHQIFKHKPKSIIYNEVLGKPFSDNVHPITDKDVYNACDHSRMYIKHTSEISKLSFRYYFAGLDWAMETKPKESNKTPIKSYTTLSVSGYDTMTGKLHVVFVKRYYDSVSMDMDNPDFVVNDIVKWLTAFNVQLFAMDYGVGHKENERIINMWDPSRVKTLQIQYLNIEQTTWVKSTEKFEVNRTQIVSDFIEEFVLKGTFRLARYDGETSEYKSDLTTLYRFNDPIKRTTSFGKTKADDFMHALIYTMFAMKYATETLPYVIVK